MPFDLASGNQALVAMLPAEYTPRNAMLAPRMTISFLPALTRKPPPARMNSYRTLGIPAVLSSPGTGGPRSDPIGAALAAAAAVAFLAFSFPKRPNR